MHRGVYKSEQKVSEQRLKRGDEATVYLLGKVVVHHWLLFGDREVNDGANEGRLEKRNDRMKVFIGVEEADISTLGKWSREKNGQEINFDRD